MESAKKKGFPFGFYVCSLSFTFERAAYYTAKWGIAIFPILAVAEGGLGLDKTQGPLLSSWIVAFTYLTPILGGFVADRWISPRLLVPIGEALMGLGYLVASRATGFGSMVLMVILVAVGTGFFKGNVSGINGRQFDADDTTTLNKAFSLQYSFVNIGSFCGTTFLTLLAVNGGVNGYRNMFMVCAVLMFIDVAWWLFGQKSLGDAGKKPFLLDNRNEDVETANIKEERTALTKKEKKVVTAILIVTFFSGIFWLIWYMVYMPVYYEFGPVSQGGYGWANWNIGSFEMPTAWFDSANGLLCIAGAPLMGALWAKMAKRPQGDWSMWKKTSVGIIILGFCVVCMVLAAIMCKQGQGKPVGIWIILLTSICMTLGELVFSPLGNAFISEYAPKQLLGTLLGAWPFIIFFAGLAYGPLYNWLENFGFVKAYGVVAILIIGCGLIMLAFDKKFDELINSPDEE